MQMGVILINRVKFQYDIYSITVCKKIKVKNRRTLPCKIKLNIYQNCTPKIYVRIYHVNRY